MVFSRSHNNVFLFLFADTALAIRMRGIRFFCIVLRENSRQVGHALGLGSTFHTPPSTWVVSERAAIRLCRLSSSISLMRDSIVFIERLLTGIVRHSRFPFSKKIEARQRRGRPFLTTVYDCSILLRSDVHPIPTSHRTTSTDHER